MLKSRCFAIIQRVYNNWKEWNYNSLLSLLELNPSAKVIDLGCGNGSFFLKIRYKVYCNEIIGVDINEDALKEAKYREVTVIRADLNHNLPFRNESFDAIVSNQVIGHLFFPVKFMREIYRVLKPGGYAIISTENLASWDNIFALILGFTPFSQSFDSGLVKIGNPLSLHNKEQQKKIFSTLKNICMERPDRLSNVQD